MTGGGESRVIGQTVELQALHRDGHEVPIELSLSSWTVDQDRYYTGILRDISERKEAEQKFRSVTDSAVDAIVSADDSSTVIGWNKAAEEIFGWTAEEMIGRPIETIIPVLDLDITEGGYPYIVMEHLDGETLEDRLRSDRPLTMRQAAEIFADVCACLASAHRAGVLHRDIKPSNLFLQRAGAAEPDSFVVKVLDFGIAKLIDEPARYQATREGNLTGTAPFMAPERLEAPPRESAALDVYSVGVALFRTLTGTLPFLVEVDPLQTLRTQRDASPLRVHDLRPGVPLELAEPVEQCLARDPDIRPRVAALEGRLRALVEQLPEADPDGGPPDAEAIAGATTAWVRKTTARRGAS